MKLRIENLSINSKQGQYGPYDVWSVTSEGKTYRSIVKDWNRMWKPGDIVEADVSRTDRGTMILVRPMEAKTNGGMSIHPKLDEIMAELKVIRHLLTLKLKAEEDLPPHTDEDYPGDPEPF